MHDTIQAIEDDLKKPGVVMMQEIRPPKGELVTIQLAWQKLGYYTYVQEGEFSKGRWDTEHAVGGVTVSYTHLTLPTKRIV